MTDPIALGEDVSRWLRAQLQRAGLAGTLAPIVVNPRTQGWIAGFLEAVSAALGLDASARYSFEARVYVSFYEGSPMGEQLGLEALAMSRQLRSMPGARGLLEQWEPHHAVGARAGAHYAGLHQAMDDLYATLRP
ncbi:MAG TPA: hypothetical protein VFA20_28200 [Myxococcaceae bacterium]|nr:hypothetical protein [Myxococcaceae bacterium]